MENFFEAVPFLAPILLIIGGLTLGLIADRFLLVRLKRFIVTNNWEGNEIFMGAIRGTSIIWLTLAGVYLATLSAVLKVEVRQAIGKTLLIVAIVTATVVVARIAGEFARLHAKKAANVVGSTTILVNLAKVVVFIIGILVLLQSLGISIAPILTALGVGGLAVALALQDTLSNLFAGIHVIASQQIRPGDYIKLDSGEEGYISDITWRHTTIQALRNNRIIVPNVKLASAIITNYSLPEKTMSVSLPVGISYDSDLERVEQICIEVANEVINEFPGANKEFAPVIRYTDFGDSSIKFNINFRAAEYADQFALKHQMIKRIHQRFKKEGMEIPYPIRTIHIKQNSSSL